ncbi:hypothetical protein SAMN05216309_1465 [Nitrosomonas europaea]|nr:hypothetical protein SAMN05216310_1475 [Nitrosomonas europaea]SET40287.1 hypothetical protein SAMN05216309_1465 [Nitrosomonas europaea]
MRRAPRLLHHHAAREVRRELIQFVVHHVLRMTPALARPPGGSHIIRSIRLLIGHVFTMEYD